MNEMFVMSTKLFRIPIFREILCYYLILICHAQRIVPPQIFKGNIKEKNWRLEFGPWKLRGLKHQIWNDVAKLNVAKSVSTARANASKNNNAQMLQLYFMHQTCDTKKFALWRSCHCQKIYQNKNL